MNTKLNIMTIMTAVIMIFTSSVTIKAQIKEHKTYRGTYHLVIPTSVEYSPKKIEGTAKYDYYDAPDGSRVFDGPFQFDGIFGGDKYIIHGTFKNDIMTGTWTWKVGNWHTFEVNFNDNGLVNGRCQWGIGTAYFNNGKMVSYDIDKNGFVLKGKYSNEKPIGNWKVFDIDLSNRRDLVLEFNDYGKVIKFGYRNPQTGDWVNLIGSMSHVADMINYPNHELTDWKNFIQNHLLRKTPDITRSYRSDKDMDAH